jgi:hypothetical protein
MNASVLQTGQSRLGHILRLSESNVVIGSFRLRPQHERGITHNDDEVRVPGPSFQVGVVDLKENEIIIPLPPGHTWTRRLAWQAVGCM